MEKARESVMENERFARYALADDSDMIAGMMGMHASFTISNETMELAAAHKPDGIGYHIHVAEGIEDASLFETLWKEDRGPFDGLRHSGREDTSRTLHLYQ